MNEDCTNPISIPVVMAKGIHLFPYRTQKLSLSAPMVLGWRRPGRVGHCRIPKRTRPHKSGVLFFLDLEMIYLPRRLSQVRHCTWLGPEPAAASGGSRQAERRESQGALARLCEFPGRSPTTPNARERSVQSASPARQLPTLPSL